VDYSTILNYVIREISKDQVCIRGDCSHTWNEYYHAGGRILNLQELKQDLFLSRNGHSRLN